MKDKKLINHFLADKSPSNNLNIMVDLEIEKN